MPTVVAMDVRRRHAFSGDTAARVVGDMGRRTWRPAAALRLPRRNDRARACVWPFRSWWGPLVSDGCYHLQLMRTAHTVRERGPHGSINPRGREGGSPYLNT
jgi:hypothetical protein